MMVAPGRPLPHAWKRRILMHRCSGPHAADDLTSPQTTAGRAGVPAPQGETIMLDRRSDFAWPGGRTLALALALAAGAAAADAAFAQATGPNSAPNPYHMDSWALQIPAGRTLGQPIGVEIDHSDGKTLWMFERCGANTCTGSKLAPIWKIDVSGQPKENFGAGMFNFPHGLYVDTGGNVWVTDGRAAGGIGETVIKFSPDGKVLMTLGKPGVAGDGPDMFNGPSDVGIAGNGDIYVADGHGEKTNDRIVKLDKTGKLIAAWGKHGSAPGEFSTTHSIALDS